jgi:hypothetical protein
MSIENNRLFFLNTISPLVNNQTLTTSKIYAYYHNKIGEKQAQQFRQFQFVFDLLDQAGRNLYVTTEDPVEIQRQKEKLSLLADIQGQIRQKMFKADSEFLDALRITLNYRYQQ